MYSVPFEVIGGTSCFSRSSALSERSPHFCLKTCLHCLYISFLSSREGLLEALLFLSERFKLLEFPSICSSFVLWLAGTFFFCILVGLLGSFLANSVVVSQPRPCVGGYAANGHLHIARTQPTKCQLRTKLDPQARGSKHRLSTYARPTMTTSYELSSTRITPMPRKRHTTQ